MEEYIFEELEEGNAIEVWTSQLCEKHGVKYAEDLTEEQLLEEIEEQRGAIANERIWENAGSNYGNSRVIEAYVRHLEDVLEDVRGEEL